MINVQDNLERIAEAFRKYADTLDKVAEEKPELSETQVKAIIKFSRLTGEAFHNLSNQLMDS